MSVRRPLSSHFEDGADAYGESASDDPAPPWPEGTLAGLSWRAGFLRARARDPFAATLRADLFREDGLDDPEVEARIALDAEAAMARRRVRTHLQGMRADLPSVAEVEAAIGEPAEAWPMRCAEIAGAVLASGVLDRFQALHGPLRGAYGVFDGEIAPGGPFPEGRARHGWLESPAGHVVDPTWWVFAGAEPCIRVSGVEDYDLAALRYRQAAYGSRPAPAFDPSERTLDWSALGSRPLAWLGALMRDPDLVRRGSVGLRQAWWLANDGAAMLGPHGGAYLDALRGDGLGALVPVDVADLLKPEEAEARTAGFAP